MTKFAGFERLPGDTLSIPTEEALLHVQSEALRQAAVSRRGSLQPGRGKWQV
jgi:hypothetical protein